MLGLVFGVVEGGGLLLIFWLEHPSFGLQDLSEISG